MPAIINQRLRWLSLAAKLSASALLLSLTGCSLVVSGYNSAPNLFMFLWLNPHLDLNAAQEKQALADLQQVLEWHRREQLPLYAKWLSQAQQLAPKDVSADQVCALIDEAAESLEPLLTQFEEPTARLGLSLTPKQLQVLRKKYTEDLKDYRKEWKLDGSKQAQLEVQTDKGQFNAERFYGRLSPAQQKLLQQLAQNSGFEGDRNYAERVRVQQDNLAVHEQMVQNRPSPEEARAMVRDWLQSVLHTPDPAYDIYLKKRKRTNCEASAQLHNTTTAEQRARAVKVLKGYEDDVRKLMRYKPS
jgi:predicted outer membrane protein